MNMFLIYRTSFQHNMVINLLLRPRQLLRRIVMNIHCDEYVCLCVCLSVCPNWVVFVSANTNNTFKASLDKFWHNQDHHITSH